MALEIAGEAVPQELRDAADPQHEDIIWEGRGESETK